MKSKEYQNTIHEYPSYYAVIPAHVRYDNHLSQSAKMMYGEITALSYATGRCFASNRYFATLYKVSISTVSRWIKQLVDCGYITNTLVYKDGSKEIETRYLQICDGGMPEPIRKNRKDNTTRNITINNSLASIEAREQAFIDSIKKPKYLNAYGITMIDDFINYWTEPTRDNSKMRFELEKDFILPIRLKGWESRSYLQ
jgi:DNA-binding transcriptional regulator YhcF (GntR family)